MKAEEEGIFFACWLNDFDWGIVQAISKEVTQCCCTEGDKAIRGCKECRHAELLPLRILVTQQFQKAKFESAGGCRLTLNFCDKW
jgi:hypothetical protein